MAVEQKGPERPWRSDADVHEGSNRTNFGPITRENSREAIKFSGGAWSEIGADPWVMRIVQCGYKIPFVTLPPLRLQGQETIYAQGVLKVVVSEPVSARAAEQGSDRANSPLPGFYSRLFLVRKATGEWRPIIRSVLPQCLRALPELHYGDTSVNLSSRQTLFCHNDTSWQFTVLSFGLSTSLRVFPKYSNLY